MRLEVEQVRVKVTKVLEAIEVTRVMVACQLKVVILLIAKV